MNFQISVIFPYHNESETLPRTLELISNQTHTPYEVIFVNSSSSDKSSDLIDKWIIDNQNKSKTIYKNIFKGTDTPASSKNAGIVESTGDWVALMDCGLIFQLNWLESHVMYATENDVKVISGVVHFAGESLVDSMAIAQTYGYKRIRPTLPSTLVHKSIFEKTGLFLENRRAGYDAAWPLLVSKMGIKRGVNEKVVTIYNGINFGSSWSFIAKKTIMYATPTVGIKHYYIPYYYLFLAFICFPIIAILGPMLLIPLGLSYLFVRGYLIPFKKSNNIKVFLDWPLSIILLPVMGAYMDFFRLIGITKGFKKYILKMS